MFVFLPDNPAVHRDPLPGPVHYMLINNGIDRFTSVALRLNVAITVVNYADGDHGFDGFNDTAQSGAIIAAALRFVQEHIRQ